MQKVQVYPQDIECVFTGTDGLGSIYVSNIEAARNIQTLARHQIKAVVTVARGGFLTHQQSQLPNYLYIPAEDVPEFQLSPYFAKAFEFIDRNLQRTNVLVHCMAGISRSVTIVVSYLMRKFERAFMDVFIQLRRRRPIINPNSGFVNQLKDFELTVRAARNASVKKQRKMSDVILEQRKSLSMTRPMTPLTQKSKSSWASSPLASDKGTGKVDFSSGRSSTRASVSYTKHMSEARKNLEQQSIPNPQATKILQRTQKPISPIIEYSTNKQPQKKSIASIGIQKTLMSKLLASNSSMSRLKQTTKYDNYKFKNSENLRDNIIKYYKKQGLGL